MEKQTKHFGLGLLEKGLQLRLPTDHVQIKYLYEAYPDWFPLPFVGCTDSQIADIKNYQGVSQLPNLYVDFLKAMGVEAGDLFVGLDVTYRFLTGYSFRKCINQIIDENKSQLPYLDDTYFGFWSQQSHSFGYFKVNESHDPSVYFYGEIGLKPEPDHPFINGPIKYKAHLSEFLSMFIAERESPTAQEQFLMEYALPYRS